MSSFKIIGKKTDRRKKISLPDRQAIEAEIRREKRQKARKRRLAAFIFSILTASSVAVLVAILWMPVLQIYGSSMYPTLREGEIVLSVKTSNIGQGDMVALKYGNKILVKRCIAVAGDWVDIDTEGNVFVNGDKIDEPYITDKSLGECNIELPYQVPDNTYFVMGDHRETSVDSRNTSVGCIYRDNIVGKIVFRLYPFSRIGITD